MSRLVISAYRPRPGMAPQLQALLTRHWPALRQQKLITERPPLLMRAADGTVLEVFERRDAAAVEQAHQDPVVQALWAEFGAVCEFVPLAALAEAQQPFAEFEPLAKHPA